MNLADTIRSTLGSAPTEVSIEGFIAGTRYTYRYVPDTGLQFLTARTAFGREWQLSTHDRALRHYLNTGLIDPFDGRFFPKLLARLRDAGVVT